MELRIDFTYHGGKDTLMVVENPTTIPGTGDTITNENTGNLYRVESRLFDYKDGKLLRITIYCKELE